MRLDAYDDTMGLEFGDYEGWNVTGEMVKEALIASSAGGGAILAATWGVRTLSEKLDLASRIENPLIRATLLSGATIALGVAGGRMMYDYNREAAMGIVGGLGGIAMASWLDQLIATLTGNEKMGMSLGEGDEYMDYGGGSGMDALAALETTGVNTSPGAFSGLADPTVTPEALMGLDGTVVQEETLGAMSGLEAYAPYLS
jgi:hypothetical protein